MALSGKLMTFTTDDKKKWLPHIFEHMKTIPIKAFDSIHARKNLASIGDKRAWSFTIGSGLKKAAILWPRILPMKWKPQYIFDIGAHRGEIALSLSILYKPIFMVLVEPLPFCKNILENHRFAPQQRIYDCALGRNNGWSTLHVNANNASSSFLRITPGCGKLFNRNMNEIYSIEVPVRTLDEIFIESGIERIDLIKLDVQGYELEVITGGLEALKNTKVIITEVSFFEHYIDQPLFFDIYFVLNRNSFELIATYDYVFDEDGMPLQCDAVFINKHFPIA